MKSALLFSTLVLLAGCAQLPPPPEDAAAKRFEVIPGKAVIYLARPGVDASFIAPVMLNDQMIGATYPGTFIRMEIPAGAHLLQGAGGDSGQLKLTTVAGQLYFVEHNAHGYRSFNRSSFQLVDATRGKMMVQGSQIASLLQQ